MKQEFDKGVIVHSIEGLPSHHLEAGRRLFQVTISDISFGALYLTPQSSTLVWDGSIDFTKLENKAREELSRVILGNNLLRYIWTVVVSLILSSEDLVEYSLSQGDDETQYKNLIGHPERIRFARYDVRVESSNPSLLYSFTAENAQLLDGGISELAVKLPASKPWSVDLVRWVFRHHSESDTLLQEADPDTVAHALSVTAGSGGATQSAG